MTSLLNLLRLADTESAKIAAEFGVHLPANVREALAHQMAIEENMKAADAAREIMNVIKDSQESLSAMVADLQAIRQKEKSLLKKIKDLARASQYGTVTSNFIPLAALTYGDNFNKAVIPKDKRHLMEVPENWVAPTPEVNPQ